MKRVVQRFQASLLVDKPAPAGQKKGIGSGRLQNAGDFHTFVGGMDVLRHRAVAGAPSSAETVKSAQVGGAGGDVTFGFLPAEIPMAVVQGCQDRMLAVNGVAFGPETIEG